MDDPVRRRRAISRAVFGQDYRVDVMLAVANHESGLVTLSEIAAHVGLTTSQIQNAWRSLVAAGLLADAPSDGSRFRYLMRQPSAAWEWAREIEAAAHQDSSRADR